VYVFYDIYHGVKYGNSSLRLEHGDALKSGAGLAGVPVRTFSTADLLHIYGDEQGQRYAFAGETHVPLALGLVYLASNLVLNSLNIFWFAKMVQTIRSRFDPPFGTKGVAKDVHYEPVEKIVEAVDQEKMHAREAIEQAKRLGREAAAASPEKKQGSVRAARERAEAAVGSPVVLGDAAEVQRASFSDGTSSVEVEGKRTLRTRRKA
jgi:hypothetical protein